MGTPEATKLSSSNDYVHLSLLSYGFWWLVILSVQVLTCLYNAGFAMFYWHFNASFLSYSLESYSIGMSRKYFPIIAYMHIGLTIIHGAYALHMIVSLFCRHPKPLSKRNNGSTKSNTRIMKKKSVFPQELGQDKTTRFVTRTVSQAYTKLADRHGFFGVNGKHFHTIVICREILETALQSKQAVQMSKFLPHPRLNLFFVVLLIVNCWSSVFIYSRWFWQGEAHRRFALVVFDCALDMVATVGVSAFIVLGYVGQYNITLAGFGASLYLDDNWVARMLNEAQMILVVSWSDMATRIVYSLGLLITTSNMKELINYNPMNKRRLGPGAPHQSLLRPKIEPQKASILFNSHRIVAPFSESSNSKSANGTVPRKKLTSRYTRYITKWKHLDKFNLLFVIWGFVILVFYLQAISKAAILECIPMVHPMAGVVPSCFVVDFNCAKLGIHGTVNEVQSRLKMFERGTTVKFHILHCSAFEMPTILKDFRKLQEIQVYNSTIAKWEDDAAVTNFHHPRLTKVSVVRTTLIDGFLPLGLQSVDFPAKLNEISFYDTNLQWIPDDIDLKWHLGSLVYIENSKLTSVPSGLIRLCPFFLVLGGNPITEVPPELFEVTGILYLVLSNTKITMLPREIFHRSNNTPFVDIRNTSISFFWSWIDPLVEVMLLVSPMILASGSVYCSELEQIMAGTLETFSAPVQAYFSPLLMNSSMQHWELLGRAVDCSPIPSSLSYFPIEDWDKAYSLNSDSD